MNGCSGNIPTESKTQVNTRKSSSRPPRRQERGRERIRQILRAAEQTFAEVGYASATTNAIAARAEISPGSLYQFFDSKEHIAQALAEAYLERLRATHALPLEQLAAQPVTVLVDAVVDAFVGFHREAPAFDALFLSANLFPDLAAAIAGLRREILDRLSAVFARKGALKPAAASVLARTCVAIFEGMLPTVFAGTPRDRRTAERELKIVLVRYLSPALEPR